MKRSLLIGAVLMTCVGYALADPPDDGSKTVTIPLDQIWGYNLPGTRDIAGITLLKQGVSRTYAALNQEREDSIELIRSRLAMKPPGEIALSGFVIPCQPNTLALRGMYSALRRKPHSFERTSLVQGDDLTLLFFSHPLSYYVRLKGVERNGNLINVYYQFEPHTTPEVTVHFAFIPLGTLPVGEYRVRYKQISIEQKYLDAGFEPVGFIPQTICRGFTFRVLEERPPDVPIER